MSIASWVAGESPREKLLDRGAETLSDAELLALILGSGYRGCDAVLLDSSKKIHESQESGRESPVKKSGTLPQKTFPLPRV